MLKQRRMNITYISYKKGSKMDTNNKKKIEYKWIIAFAMFLMIFIGLGFCSSAKNIYIAPITSALGFSRSAFSISDSLRYAVVSIVNIFFAGLIKKFGTKKLIGAGGVFLVLYSVIYAVSDSLIGFYLGGILLGLGVTFTSTAMVGVVINKWFAKHKGTVLGVVLASNGIGAAIAVQIFTPIIYKDTFGYRNSYYLLAAIIAVLTVIIMVLYKENAPELEVDHNAKKEANKKLTEEWRGLDYKTLLKRPYFYLIIAAILFGALTSAGVIVTPYLSDVGLDSEFVASTTSIMLITLALAKVAVGFIYDKFGVMTSVNLCYLAGIVSNITLFFINNTQTGKFFAILQGVLSSIATPIQTVMLPILALAIFGQNNYDRVLGLLVTVTAVGQALCGPVVNLSFDLLGSYEISFILSTAASVIILIVINYAVFASKKERETC